MPSLLPRAMACAIALAGCSSFVENQAASSTYRIIRASVDVAKRQPDIELAREAMPGGIVQLQAFAAAYPGHGFDALYAESVCQYASAFVFDDWEDADLGGRRDDATRLATRVTKLLGTCVEANLALLPPAIRDVRAHGGELAPLVTRDQVPAVRWLATSDAIAIALDPASHLATLPATLALLARCSELSPLAHDADVELLLGTLEAGLHRLLGGKDGSARFDAARRGLPPGVLLVEVMYARGVAVARKDRALFEHTLQAVLATDLDRWPDHRLANELALRKARRYLAAEDQLIPAP
jgi:hypothetical protein